MNNIGRKSKAKRFASLFLIVTAALVIGSIEGRTPGAIGVGIDDATDIEAGIAEEGVNAVGKAVGLVGTVGGAAGEVVTGASKPIAESGDTLSKVDLTTETGAGANPYNFPRAQTKD